jgi:hypothetical protein
MSFRSMPRKRLLALLTVATVALFASDTQSASPYTGKVLERLRHCSRCSSERTVGLGGEGATSTSP